MQRVPVAGTLSEGVALVAAPILSHSLAASKPACMRGHSCAAVTPDEELTPVVLVPGRPAWAWRQRPTVMGILNVTPDSFSDGGAYLSVRTALAKHHGGCVVTLPDCEVECIPHGGADACSACVCVVSLARSVAMS